MNKKTKHERMELRKEIGNRVITPPSPPPYNRGAPYLIPHACFNCRKSFKIQPSEKTKEHYCPECNSQLHDMGRNFRPPRKSDKNKWKVIEKLYSAGFRFLGSGMHDGDKLPENLCDVDRSIEEHPNHPLRINKQGSPSDDRPNKPSGQAQPRLAVIK